MSENQTKRLKTIDYSILQQCMHCGMCLPSCPTYSTTKKEINSPRGRISLMRAVADEKLDITKAFSEEMYYCLGCLACESACPAGVSYAPMFEAARADIEDAQLLAKPERTFWRYLIVKTVFTKPRLLHLIGRSMYLYQASGLQGFLRKYDFFKLLPEHLKALEPLTPSIKKKFSTELIQQTEKPNPPRARYRIGMLTGCVQDLAFSDINRDTVDVLLANGCEVTTPRNQTCCGSLHSHNGEEELAKKLARSLIDSFDLEQLDAIISNAGGCGSHLRHYGRLLADDPDYAAKARLWDSKLSDIHEWLDTIDLVPPGSLAKALVATYHPSCHLHHGQKVKVQPEKLLRLIPNLTLAPLAEADWCCGSAGIYNITQPEEAKRLQDRKTNNIRKTNCDVVVTANPGCHIQIDNGLSGKIPVLHPVTLLAQAYNDDKK